MTKEATNDNGKTRQLKIELDQDRLGDLVTVDEFIGMQEGKFKLIKQVMAHFVVNDQGKYLSHEEGMAVIGQLTINQLNKATAEFIRLAENSASPPENGAGSGQP